MHARVRVASIAVTVLILYGGLALRSGPGVGPVATDERAYEVPALQPPVTFQSPRPPSPVDRLVAAPPTRTGVRVPDSTGVVMVSDSSAEDAARAARVDELERLLRVQRIDVRESAALRGYLEGAIVDLGTNASLLDVACRETLCRVELHFQGPDEAAQLAQFAVDPDQRREVFVEPTDNGGLTVVSYLFRDQEGSAESASL